MRRTVPLLVVALGCSPAAAPAPREQDAPGAASPGEASTGGGGPWASATVSREPNRPRAPAKAATSSDTSLDTPTPRACAAPSLTIRGPADARDAAALEHCQFQPTGDDGIGNRCGQPGREREVKVDRLDEAVEPLDRATAAHVRAIAAKGRQEGRRSRVFGLLGDSITASPKFMTPLSDLSNVALSLEAEEHLRVDDLDIAMSPDGDVATAIDVYFGQNAYRGLDSFVAPRGAKVGAQSRWALAGHPSPLDRLISQLSPAVVVVLYGSNDAAVRFGDLDALVEGYTSRMSAIVDRLEAAGIVPVLTTVPRHTLDPKRPNCDRKAGDGSNWRMAVQTSAVSAAAAELACARALPLIDLRWALDAIPNHGIGTDGVHPNAFRSGSAILDEQGLQCGYNVRNYVTLRMLGRLWPLVKAPQSHP